MSNNQNPNRYTAMNIFKAKYWNNRNSGSGLDSKKYFETLRKSVITELESTGYCELLDCFIEGRIDEIDHVTYAVFTDIVRKYSYNDSADVFNNPKYAEYVPYINVPYTWCASERTPIFYSLNTQGIIETLYEARYYGRTVHVNNCRQNKMCGAEPQKNQKELLQRAEKAERELQRMKDNESQITREAQKQAVLIVSEAQEKADSIKREAQTVAASIAKNAQTVATSIKRDAQTEANSIKRNAQTEANSIKRNAQTEADAIVDKARKDSVERADELVGKYIADSQKRYKNELEDDMGRLSEEYLSKTKRADDYHEDMNNSTNKFQVEWVRTMDNALEQLNAVKADFYKYLHDWQSSLYKNQTEPLAERFVELYRIINVDKLLREEIIFQAADEHGTGASTNENFAPYTSEASSASDATVIKLQKLNNNLNTFLRRFEFSLNALDLYVFYPKAGEMFDDMYHVLEDEDAENVGRVISECIIPGIKKKANDDFGDDVVIRAEVRTETER